MYQLSDSESTDSEHGIRFKTDSTRNKAKNKSGTRESEDSRFRRDRRSRDRRSTDYRRSHSPYYKRDEYRRRESRRDRSSSKSRSPKHISKKHDKQQRKMHKSRTEGESESRKRSRSSSRSIKNDRNTPPSRRKESGEERMNSLGSQVKDIDVQLNETLTSRQGDIVNCPNKKPIAFGPALPPHLVKINVSTSAICESKKLALSRSNSVSDLDTLQHIESEGEILGQTLPEHLIQNSALEKDTHLPSNTPISSKSETENPNSTNSTGDLEVVGPALPPHFSITCTANADDSSEAGKVKCIGPLIPSHLREKLADSASQEIDVEEDGVFGPLPLGTVSKSEAHIALEERALQMKIDQLSANVDDKVAREEWMVDLPQVHASNLGLGPRQFRAKPAPDLSDRSSWTDTPGDKARKATGKVEARVDLKEEAELMQLQKRDKEQEKLIKSHKKKRKEKSLVEIHQDKLKEKKQQDEGANERRPFSRDIDLKVNRFDEAQKKAILKKAQLLDDRFSRGQSKFL